MPAVLGRPSKAQSHSYYFDFFFFFDKMEIDYMVLLLTSVIDIYNVNKLTIPVVGSLYDFLKVEIYNYYYQIQNQS